jgi:hypothetical protein
MWLILAVSACWIASEQLMGGFVHPPIGQDDLPKKTHSPIHIRPPPLLA